MSNVHNSVSDHCILFVSFGLWSKIEYFIWSKKKSTKTKLNILDAAEAVRNICDNVMINCAVELAWVRDSTTIIRIWPSNTKAVY